MPKSWESKVTAIQEVKRLKTQPLDQLLGSSPIRSCLETIKNKIKKGIALKATKQMEEELDDEDVVLFTRKFKPFLKKKANERRDESSNKKGDMISLKCTKSRAT